MLAVSLLANATDVDQDTLSVTGFMVDANNDGVLESFTAGQVATIAGVGTLMISSNGNYTFTPESNYNGLVPVATYTVADGQGGTDTSTLSIAITPLPNNSAAISLAGMTALQNIQAAAASDSAKALTVAELDHVIGQAVQYWGEHGTTEANHDASQAMGGSAQDKLNLLPAAVLGFDHVLDYDHGLTDPTLLVGERDISLARETSIRETPAAVASLAYVGLDEIGIVGSHHETSHSHPAACHA